MKSEELKRRHVVINEWRAQADADAAPLLAQLAERGFAVRSVGSLYGDTLDYREVVGLLAHWLPKISNPAVRESIVRALSVKWAKKYGHVLVDEFHRSTGFAEDSLQWAVGSALEVVATKAIAEEMIAIAREPRYGKSREMVAWGLRKLKCEASAQALIELLDDPDVSGHALGALERRKVPIPRETLDSFIADDRPWVRKHAKRLLAVLEGSS